MSRNLQGRSRAKWRDMGFFVDAGEHISRVGKIVRRHDLFGFADLVAIKCGEIVFLQVTSWSNVSARVNKIACEDHGLGKHKRPMSDIAKILLSVAGVRIIVEGWKQTESGRWVSREVDVTPLLLDARRRRRCPEKEVEYP